MNRRVVALIAVISPIVTGFQPATGSARLPAPPADTVRFAVRAPDYWPTIGWRESTPEEQGLSGRALAKAVDQVSERGLPLHNLLIIRHGVVVLDANVVRLDAVKELHPWSHGDYRVVLKDGTTLTWSRRFRAINVAAFRPR